MEKMAKICGCCKIEKSVGDFNRSKRTLDGFVCYCKICEQVKRRVYKERNRKKFLEKSEESKDVKKICKCCSQEKELSEFGADKWAADLRSRYCKDCARKKEREYRKENREHVLERSRAYRRNNREKFREKGAKYREENKEKYLKDSAKWYNANRVKCLEYFSEYRKNNKEKIKETNRKHLKKKRDSNLSFKLKMCLSVRLRTVLKSQNATKSSRIAILLGCSVEELRAHLESLFTKGMTWDNYGEWHIDHKKPCAAFNLTDPKQQEECFHYTNLQPLWRKDNIEKSSFYKGKKHFHSNLQL